MAALTITDEEHRTTTFGYDAASQLTGATDALNQSTVTPTIRPETS
jgi:YD repeat-containing protein